MSVNINLTVERNGMTKYLIHKKEEEIKHTTDETNENKQCGDIFKSMNKAITLNINGLKSPNERQRQK